MAEPMKPVAPVTKTRITTSPSFHDHDRIRRRVIIGLLITDLLNIKRFPYSC
jgi:hypothetical protein